MGAIYTKILEGKYQDTRLMLDQDVEPKENEKEVMRNREGSMRVEWPIVRLIFE